MGVNGQSLPPKNDFEHARGLRNSAYAVNLTYDRHTTYRQHIYIYHVKSRLNTPVLGSLCSPNKWLLCTLLKKLSESQSVLPCPFSQSFHNLTYIRCMLALNFSRCHSFKKLMILLQKILLGSINKELTITSLEDFGQK